MRRLAEIALAQGFSQESLAKRLRDDFGLKAIGKNVYDHFVAPHPHRKTIERYAKILNVSDETLRIIEGGTLTKQRLQSMEREVFRCLAIFRSDFQPSVVKAIKKALREPGTRARVLGETAMTWNAPVGAEWSTIPAGLGAFARALAPALDLRRFIRKYSKGESALFMIYSEALALYEDSGKALAFVDACAAILRLDGFDTQPMYDRFRDTLRGIHRASRGKETA
jgi:hypothetical protein